MTDDYKKFIQHFSKWLKSCNIENGCYEFKMIITQSDAKVSKNISDKIYTYFREELEKVSELEVFKFPKDK